MVGSRTVRGVTWNLSQGGMQVETADLKPEDAVRVSFGLPVSRVAIEAAGTVLWAGEKRQGIQFTNVSVKNQESIRKYIAEVDQVDRINR